MKPALLVDFDGVLAPFGVAGHWLSRPKMRERGFEWLTHGGGVWMNPAHAPMLMEFADTHGFELVWCTLRDYEITTWIPFIYGFPDDLASVDFTTYYSQCEKRKWKYEDVEAFAGERPIAWLDDSFDADPTAHRQFLQDRRGPTKVVHVAPYEGLQQRHLVEVAEWWDMIRV